MMKTAHDWANIQGITCKRNPYYNDAPEGELPERYGDWRDAKDGTWLVPNYTSGSDYSGGLVCRSNYLVFCEEFDDGADVWWRRIYGGHGTYGVILDTARAPAEALEFFAKLEVYPLADEDHHSNLEVEAENEAWTSFLRKDFVQAIERATEQEDLEPTDEQAWTLFHELCESTNTYWEHTDEGPWIDVKRLLEHLEPEDVAEWPGFIAK